MIAYTYISQEMCCIKDSDTLGCVTVSLGVWFLIFQRITVPSSLNVKQSTIWTWTPCPLTKDTLRSLKWLGPTHPKKEHHITDDLNPQQLQCENLNFSGHTKCSLTFIRSSRHNSLWTFSLRGLSSSGFKVSNSWMAALKVTRLKLQHIKKLKPCTLHVVLRQPVNSHDPSNTKQFREDSNSHMTLMLSHTHNKLAGVLKILWWLTNVYSHL